MIVALNKLADIRAGLAVTRRMHSDGGEDIPVISTGDLADSGITTLGNLERIHVRITPRSRSLLCRPGDVLLTARGTVLRSGVVGAEQAGALVSANLLLIRPDQSMLLSAMLAAYLQTGRVQQELMELGRSNTGQLSLSAGRLASLEIEVPPLVVQRKIAQLEENCRAYQTAALTAICECRHVVSGIIEAILTQRDRFEE